MTRQLLVRQGGGSASEVDFINAFSGRKGAPLLEDAGGAPLLQVGQRFANGESAQGYFRLVDPAGALSTSGFRLRPWCEVRFTEDASGDELTLGWMRVSGADGGRRGPYIGGDDIEHTPQLMDCNVELRGIPFTEAHGWERPAETDRARLEDLKAAKLDGPSSAAEHSRDTTDVTVSTVASGHLMNVSSTTDLEARDYPTGTEVSEIISDIAEQSGKIWGVVLHHDAGSTHRCLLYIDQDDFTTWTSDVRISDQLSDLDPDDEDAPTFEPHWLQGAGRESNNEGVISGLVSIYTGSKDKPGTVFVETGEAPEDWEQWIGVFNDGEAHSLTQATRRANWELEDRKRPFISHRVSIKVKAEQAHLVEAGQAIQTKSVVMNSGPDKASWVWRRVAQKQVEPIADGTYWLHLNLERPRSHGTSNGEGQPASTTPKPAPEHVPNPGDTVVKFYNANDAGGDDILWDGILGNQGGDPGDGAGGSSFYYFKSTAPDRRQESWAATAGSTYRIEGSINSASSGQMDFAFFSVAAGTDNPTSTFLLESHVITSPQPDSGNSWSLFTAGPFTAPVGTVSAALGRFGGGVSFDEVTIYEVGDVTENDPDAVDYGTECPHESTHFLPSDWVICRLEGIEGNVPHVLDDLNDVDTETSPPTDGDALVYDGSAEQWVPGAGTGNFLTKTGGEGHTIQVTPDAGAAFELDLAAANVFEITLTEDCTISATGFGADEWCEGAVIVHQDSTGGWDLTYDTPWQFPDGEDGTLPNDADTTSGFAFGSLDGGTTVYWSTDSSGTGSGVTDHGALTGLGDDDHTQYIKDTEFAAKGDLLGGTGSGTFDNLTVGTNGYVLAADSGETTGLKWVAVGDVPSGDIVQIATGAGSIRIPGLAGDGREDGVGTGGSVGSEYSSGTTGLTWSPTTPTTDVNSTVPDHLYISWTGSGNAETLGTKAWSPAGAFDARIHVAHIIKASDANSAGVGLIITSSGDTSRALVQFNPQGLAGPNITAFTYASSTYTQRGSTIGTGIGFVPMYLRITRDGSNNVAFFWGTSGRFWSQISTLSFTFTVANIGYRLSESGTTTLQTAVDFLRTDV